MASPHVHVARARTITKEERAAISEGRLSPAAAQQLLFGLRAEETASTHPQWQVLATASPDGGLATCRNAIVGAFARYSQFLGDGAVKWLSEFPAKFPQKLAELEVLTHFASLSLKPTKPRKDGADVILSLGALMVDIECVAPSHVATANPSREDVLLKYTAALRDKNAQISRRCSRLPDTAARPRIVAVLADDLPNADQYDVELPLIISALTGFVRTGISVGVYPHEFTESFNEVRRYEQTRNGSSVDVRPFEDGGGAYEEISAILFRRHNPFTPWLYPAAREFGLIHNPAAKVPLPYGSLPVRAEYLFDAMGVLRSNGRNLAAFAAPLPRVDAPIPEHHVLSALR